MLISHSGVAPLRFCNMRGPQGKCQKDTHKKERKNLIKNIMGEIIFLCMCVQTHIFTLISLKLIFCQSRAILWGNGTSLAIGPTTHSFCSNSIPVKTWESK